MFPVRESRFKSAFRRSLDAAIEFATLGEYGYAPAWDAGDSAVVTDRRDWLTEAPDWDFGASSTPSVLEPASAAGRARVNADRRSAPSCAGQPLRGRALTPTLPRASRQRGGMAPREHTCTAE